MPLRSYTEAERLVTERRRVEQPLIVLVWLGIAAFSLADGNTFYFFAGTLCAGLNLAVASFAREVYLRRVFVNIGVLGATGVLLAELLGGRGDLLSALGHYLILIQLCKLFERRGNRDYVQLLTMSLLLVVSATILCHALWFALLLVVHLILMCYTAMVFTLKRGLDEVAAGRLATESGPLAPQRVAWNVMRDWPARALRRRLGVVLIAVLATGVVMFLIVPRVRPIAGGVHDTVRGAGSSGYSDTVQLGDVKSVYLSQRMVMRVKFSGDLSDPASWYLRGQIFESYADSRWAPTPTVIRARPGIRPPAAEGKPRRVVQEIVLNRPPAPRGFAIYPAVRVDTDAGPVRVGANGQIHLPEDSVAERKVHYTVESWLQPLSAEQRRYLANARSAAGRAQRPAIRASARVTELARQWCRDLLRQRGDHPDRRDELDLAIARRIEGRLRAECEYTLDLSGTDPGRDGVEDFLFHMKRGHCEYFASAMVVMCHAMGVRARLATGFYVDPGARSGETYIVRERDAHAWAEVFTPATDWVVMDATPAGRPAHSTSWWMVMANYWERLRSLWQERVAGYDARAQRRLWGRTKAWLDRVYRTAAGAVRDLREGLTNLLLHGYVDRAVLRFVIALAAVAIVIEVFVVVHVLRRTAQVRRERRSAMGAQWKDLAFMPRLLRLLERHGIGRARHRTPRDLVHEAVRGLHVPRESIEPLVALYYRVRWGRAAMSREEVRAARRQLRRIREILRK